MSRRRFLPRLCLVVAGAAAWAPAQEAALLVTGGRVHARAGVAVEEASILVVGGKIKAVGKDLVAPEGATIVDAAGLDVYPSLIDPLNDGLLENYPAARGALGATDRALDLVDRFAEDRRGEMRRAGVGVVGLGAAVGGARSGVSAVVFTEPGADGAPIVLGHDRFVQFDVAARQRGGAAGFGPFGGLPTATVVSLPLRTAAVKALEETLDAAKKYREAWEKYEKDYEEYKKKVAEGKGADSKPADAPGEKKEEKKEEAAPSGPPEGFRNWPRDKQREWMRENLRRGRGASAESAPESRPSGSTKLKPPEKPKTEPDKEALVRVLKRETPLWVGVEWEQDLVLAIELARKRDVKLALLGAAEATRVIDKIKDVRAMVVLPAPVIYDEDPLGGAPEDLCRILAKAGVPFTFATAGQPEYGPGGLRFAAALAIGRGLTEEQALRAVTLHAAQSLGMEKSLGSIEPGKEAHLMILKGSPFAPDAKVVKMVTRGRVTATEP
jgi:hypothetical protein